MLGEPSLAGREKISLMIALANDLLHQQNIEYIMRFISKKKS